MSDWSVWLPTGGTSSEGSDSSPSESIPSAKQGASCECGCHKVYGNSCDASYHSDWCPISPNYKEKTNES